MKLDPLEVLSVLLWNPRTALCTAVEPTYLQSGNQRPSVARLANKHDVTAHT